MAERIGPGSGFAVAEREVRLVVFQIWAVGSDVPLLRLPAANRSLPVAAMALACEVAGLTE